MNMKGFSEVRNAKKKSTRVVQEILSALSNDVYRPRDKLPPERVLAGEMKVSRACIREALSALKVLGLVESKVGDGTYVLPGGSENRELLQVLFSARRENDLLDIWEARAEIEAVIVKLATEFATQKTIARMERYLEDMQSMVVAQDMRGYLNIDRDFHLAIARGTDNPLLESIIRPLIGITNDDLLENILPSHLPRRLQESFSEHKKILIAIQNRDEEAAVLAVRNHFNRVREFYGRRFW